MCEREMREREIRERDARDATVRDARDSCTREIFVRRVRTNSREGQEGDKKGDATTVKGMFR